MHSGKIPQLAKLNNSTFKSPIFCRPSFITHCRKLREKVLTEFNWGKLHFLNFCDFFSDSLIFISPLIPFLNCIRFFLLYSSNYQRTIFQLLGKTYAWASVLLYWLHESCSLFNISKSFVRMFKWRNWAVFWWKKFLQRIIITFFFYSKKKRLDWCY